MDECCVCLDETNLKKTPCEHILCNNCLNKLTRCPMCTFPLNFDFTEMEKEINEQEAKLKESSLSFVSKLKLNHKNLSNLIDKLSIKKRDLENRISIYEKRQEPKKFIICEGEMKGYKFYSGLDSAHNDSRNFPDKTIQEMKKICDDNDFAGFNTLGWLKYEILDDDKLHPIPKWNDCPNPGLYVKIEQK